MNKSIYSKSYKKMLEMLKEARCKSGLTQEELASALGTTQSVISKCERGERRIDFIEFVNICSQIDLNPVDVIHMIRLTTEEN